MHPAVAALVVFYLIPLLLIWLLAWGVNAWLERRYRMRRAR